MPASRELPADWLLAFQDMQAQTAAAHESFQRAMAESHTAYLKLAETALGGWSALLHARAQRRRPGARGPPHAAPAAAAPPKAPGAARTDTPAEPGRARTRPTPVWERAVPRAFHHPAKIAGRARSTGSRRARRSCAAIDLPALLLAIVADKTGYPVDMLNLDMDLEGDLGIDSIKRVEILAAVDERAPQLPKVDRARLGAMRTLAEIVVALGTGHLHGAGGTGRACPRVRRSRAAAMTPRAPHTRRPMPGPIDLPALLLSIVADKTGYPVDMLNLDMDLEGDLGIDSIKRVEILAAVDERAPDLPKVDRARLGAMRTLAEIVAALGDGTRGTGHGAREERAHREPAL
ncbi:MAG: hypothetical protein IPO66_08925 [Rhodanobacteraceae bacterium]|nr:hypothetical protein [Rhodanobacteraceae bacterium]